MKIITLIGITAILGCGLSLMASITLFWELTLDRQPSSTAGVRFLFFKHRFGKRKQNVKAKSKPVQKKSASETPPIDQLHLILHEHQLIRQTAVLFTDCVKKALMLPEQYYIHINLSGGFRSPDITGQVFGLVQAGSAIPSQSLCLAYHPDFTSDRLQGTIAAGAVFKAYKLVILLSIIIWRLPKIKLIKIYRKVKKGGSYV